MEDKITVDEIEGLNQMERDNGNDDMDTNHHHSQGRKKISIELIANIPLSRSSGGGSDNRSHLHSSNSDKVVESNNDDKDDGESDKEAKHADHSSSKQGSVSSTKYKRTRRSLPPPQSDDDGERPLKSKVKQVVKSKDIESKMSDGEGEGDIESKVDAKPAFSSSSLIKSTKQNGSSKQSNALSTKKSNGSSKIETLDKPVRLINDSNQSLAKKKDSLPVVESHSSKINNSHNDGDQNGEKRAKQKKAIASASSPTASVTSEGSEVKSLAKEIEKKKKSISAISSKIQQRTPTKSPASLMRMVSPITAMEAVSILKVLSGRPAIEEDDDEIVKSVIASTTSTTIENRSDQPTPSKAMSDALSALQEVVGSPSPSSNDMATTSSTTAVIISTANDPSKIDEKNENTENRNDRGDIDIDISKKRERSTELSESVQDSNSIQSSISSFAVKDEFDNSNKKQKTAKGRASSKSAKMKEIQHHITNLKVGTRVYCNWMNSGSWFAGEITKVNADKGTFDIDYDDGDIEHDVPEERFKKEEIKLRLGQEIKANWQNQGIYYRGRILKIHNYNTKFDIKYEDGDEETDVPRRNIKLISYKVDDRVIVNYLGKGEWFQGVVKRVNGCLYDVQYVDGDNEINILPHNIVMDLIELPIKSRVIANWKGNGAYLPGRVIKKELDRKYTVEYDDGEIENGVQRKWMRNESYLSLHKGQKVLVNYKNDGIFFPGKVHQIHKVAGEDPSEKVYDIHYDDGDSESKVTVDRINPIEEPHPLHVGQRVAGK